MKVAILHVHGNDRAVVKGSCGEICGVWKGDDLTPEDIGLDYNIELSFLTQPKPSICDPTQPGFQSHLTPPNAVGFKGLVEQVYEDGVVDFRLSEDLIVLLRVQNGLCRENDWIFFELNCGDVEIYPF